MQGEKNLRGTGHYWVRFHGSKQWTIAYLKFEYEGSFYYVGRVGSDDWSTGLDSIAEMGDEIKRPEYTRAGEVNETLSA